jgi:hypothetical protein
MRVICFFSSKDNVEKKIFCHSTASVIIQIKQ